MLVSHVAIHVSVKTIVATWTNIPPLNNVIHMLANPVERRV